MRKILETALLRNRSKLFIRVNTILGAITILSILAIALSTVAELEPYRLYFVWVEYFAAAVFALEYIARVYVHDRKLSYIFSPFGLIDVISFLPSLVGFSNLTFVKAARIARILAFLRMSRLAKLARLNKFSNHNSLKAREIQSISIRIYSIVLITATLVFGTLLYAIEGHNEQYKDIPTATLWAVFALIGGDVSPAGLSMFAKLIIVCLQFSSLLLFGLMIHIVGRFVETKLLGSSSLD